MSDIIPIFKTNGSLGRGTFTVENEDSLKEGEHPIKNTAPVSVYSIAKKYKLENVTVIDNGMLLFPELYKNINRESGLIFGCNFTICKDAKEKSEESPRSECKIAILIKNSQGYKDFLALHNEIMTNRDYFYYHFRLDYEILQKFWTENLELVIPPYDNFIHRNLLNNGVCNPCFGKIKPSIFYANMSTLIDVMLAPAIINYAKNNELDIFECHPVYYYKNTDCKTYMNFRCIGGGTEFSKPEIGDFCSDKFSWEAYCKKTGIEFYDYPA
jgi:DNA polymerase III alpha subunit